MEYKKRKRKLLESLFIKEADISFSDLLPGGKVVLSKEEKLEDEASELITEILEKIKSRL